MASDFAEWSPYNYTFNNPILYTDPDGRAPEICIPCLVGAAAGIGTDYTLQVAGNLIEGQSFRESLTNIDGKSLAVSGASGFAGVGIIKNIKSTATLVKRGQVAAEMVVDGSLNAVQQKVMTGEVNLNEVAVSATTGTILRGKAQDAVNNSAAPKAQQLSKEATKAAKHAKSAAKNSSRQGKINQKQQAADNAQKSVQQHQSTTNAKAAASGVISSGAPLKAVKTLNNNSNEND